MLSDEDPKKTLADVATSVISVASSERHLLRKTLKLIRASTDLLEHDRYLKTLKEEERAALSAVSSTVAKLKVVTSSELIAGAQGLNYSEDNQKSLLIVARLCDKIDREKKNEEET